MEQCQNTSITSLFVLLSYLQCSRPAEVEHRQVIRQGTSRESNKLRKQRGTEWHNMTFNESQSWTKLCVLCESRACYFLQEHPLSTIFFVVNAAPPKN